MGSLGFVRGFCVWCRVDRKAVARARMEGMNEVMSICLVLLFSSQENFFARLLYSSPLFLNASDVFAEGGW